MSVRLDMRALERLINALPKHTDDFVAAVAQDVKTDIVLSFGTGKRGRTYKRGRRVVHVASAPGSPPMVDTGALRASIHIRRMGNAHYRVQDGVPYGVFLELGGRRMAARPFVRPVFARWRGELGNYARRFGLVVRAVK